MPPRRVSVIFNLRSGPEANDALRRRLVELLERHGITARIHWIEGGGKISEIAEAALRDGSFAVAAGGGDGTLSAVAAALVDSECALGVLPVGTFNHFAKDMRVPLELEKAVHTIATGAIRRIDVGEVNGRIFINNSSLGLYPSIVRGREQGQRLGRNKWRALLWATLAVLRRYPLLSVRLTSGDGRKWIRRTPLVFIGNNRYEMRGFEIGWRPALDEGLLAVYVAHQDGPAALIGMGIRAVLGGLQHGVDFDFTSTECLQIEATRKTIQVATDGEVAKFVPPLLYRIRPLALRVIVPAAE